MTHKNVLFFSVFVVLIAATTICTAQPPGMPIYGPGGIPNNPESVPGGQVSIPSYNQPNMPGIPGGLPATIPTIMPPGIGIINESGQGQLPSQEGHPATGPLTSQPVETPSASTGHVLSSFGEGQELTSSEIVAAFGSEPQGANGNNSAQKNMQLAYQFVGPSGIQYWAYYNGFWTQGPSAVWFGQQMNMIAYNDQPQNIYAYELYPNNFPKWYYWGYRMPGNFNTFFVGDMKGWHECAIWGDKSGWSNVLWIYVW